MMPQPLNETALCAIKQQAVDWLICLQSDEVSDAELHAFASWLAEEHAHSEAFAAAEKLYAEMSFAANTATITENSAKKGAAHTKISSKLASSLDNSQRLSRSYKHRQRWLVPSMAMAAVCLLATLLYLPQQFLLLDRLSSDYYTQTGEVRGITLSDGSHLLLNTNSAVSVDYDKSIRLVTLYHGQVRFTVAKDAARPFEVAVGDVRVRALGTVFQIYKADAEHIKVTVQEHSVAVRRPLNELSQSGMSTVAVKTGQQLNIHDLQALAQPETISLTHETAWQQQRLIINDQPLGDLIAELERYQLGRIFLADKKLNNLRVSGVFSLEDPEAVLNSVTRILNLKETRLGPWWVILSR